jgi:hypothetical protein
MACGFAPRHLFLRHYFWTGASRSVSFCVLGNVYLEHQDNAIFVNCLPPLDKQWGADTFYDLSCVIAISFVTSKNSQQGFCWKQSIQRIAAERVASRCYVGRRAARWDYLQTATWLFRLRYL